MNRHYCHLFFFDVVKVWNRTRPSAGLPSSHITEGDVIVIPVCMDCGARRPSRKLATA